MVELGKYFLPVVSAYAATVLALGALIGVTWIQARKTRRALITAEARKAARDGA